ncbi:hypothetical protein [Neptunomonas sp.]|uniref:hypothetical protein n=1 Tax=Neptunomonas sp. TaxID=1971898 RepID=UPI0025EFBE29|nr:hypothetical protein [Neptunomonas sp.]
MKIIIVVKRSETIGQHDTHLQEALTEAFSAKTDTSNIIVVVSIGSTASMTQLDTALAIGADKGIQVITQDSLSAFTIAELMTDIVKREKPELLIISKELSNEQRQTGKILSSMITDSFPVTRSKLDRNQYKLIVIREMQSGAHTVLLPIEVESNSLKPWRSLQNCQEFLPFNGTPYLA